MRFGFAGEIVIPTLPIKPLGKPVLCVISVQCSPASVVLKMPPPVPPLISIHGLRPACQSAAYKSSGLLGSITSSIAPVESLRKRTFFQVLPPSVVLKTPRSGFVPQTCPSAATYATSPLRGSMRKREICCVSFRPIDVHVFPASVVFHTPSPYETLPRIGYSPPPTHTTSGFFSSTAIAPMDPPK